MPHYDEETLALLALGEADATVDRAAHLATCAACRAEVDELRSVVAVGRSIEDGDYPAAPSPAVWDRIVAEIHVADVAPPADAAASAEVVSLAEARQAPRRSRWMVSLAAAAAVGLIVGIGGTWAVTRTSPPVQVAQGQVRIAALEPLDIPTASGTATLREVSTDQRTMTVAVANLPTQPATFYEVWLMDPSDSQLVALGILGADGKGVYVVPPGLDLAQYTAVDVSLQPMNGSPEHSSTSAVRGVLPA